MKSKTMMRMLGTLALVGMTLPAAAAETQGWYFGGNFGQTRARIAEQEIIADLATAGLATSNFDSEDRDVGFKLLAGYQITPHLAIEGGYFDLGEFGYNATTIPAGTLDGNLVFRGWNLDLVGMVPITQRVSAFARIGAHHSKANVDFVGTGAVNVLDPHFSERKADAKAGFGVQYRLSDSLALRAEAERFQMDDAVGNTGELDMFSLGVVYKFGRTAAAPRAATPPPAPAPALVVVPLPVATEEYCSLLDIQFEINQDEMELAEKERLAVLARFLQLYPDTSAVIEGHTDNVGSPARNMQLSESRAQSVVDYLVREHQIAPSRLRAVGLGETRPIADNSTQDGQRANRRINTLIGCATDIAGLETLPARVTLAMLIEFDTNSAVVKREYHDQLGKVARFITANPRITATMEGHADNATPDMAQRISRQRAESVASYLVKEFGVDRSRLKVEGFGQTRRFNYNTSAEGRQENRRVNIIFSYPN